MNSKRATAFRLSTTVALVLAVLTAVEYFVALQHAGATILFLLALAKAYCVVNYFMHISRLWRTDGGH
jgi:heme/copper-type cytochrome/quinol oxidase subunit 4